MFVCNPCFVVGTKFDRSGGFPCTEYFVHGRDGMGAWQISGIVGVSVRALSLFYSGVLFLFRFRGLLDACVFVDISDAMSCAQ